MTKEETLGAFAIFGTIILILLLVIAELSFNIGRASGERDTLNRVLVKQGKLYPEAYDATIDQDVAKRLSGGEQKK